MLKARIESAASAFTDLSPLVRNLPPPDISLIVPNGSSTVHRRMVIKLGSAWMRDGNPSFNKLPRGKGRASAFRLDADLGVDRPLRPPLKVSIQEGRSPFPNYGRHQMPALEWSPMRRALTMAAAASTKVRARLVQGKTSPIRV